MKRGTLKRGDILVAGKTWCRARMMFNDQGKPITQAGPSTPVELSGWKDIPVAGDVVIGTSTEVLL